MLKRLRDNSWFHPILMLIIGVVGIGYAIYLGFSVHKINKENLIIRANTISQFITAQDIETLSGSEKDLTSPKYLGIKDRLTSLRSVNPDIRFVYISGMREGQVFFYVDSEDSQSSFYSPPGQKYEEASDLMKNLFREKKGGFEIAGDRWGVWASAMVPITDQRTGEMVALLGLDVPSRKYIFDILAYGLSPLFFAALVIALLFLERHKINTLKKAQESLEARNFELVQMNRVLKDRENEMDELKKEIGEINEKLDK